MTSSVGGFIDAAFFVWTVSVAQGADVDNICVSRIDHDSTDLARVFQADVRPCRAAIHGFINAVARREIRTNVGLAGSSVDRLRVGWSYGNGPDRADRLFVEDRL